MTVSDNSNIDDISGTESDICDLPDRVPDITVESSEAYLACMRDLLERKPVLNQINRYVLTAGYGAKRGPGMVHALASFIARAWKRRYFVLVDDCLIYSDSLTSPIFGLIPLRGAEVAEGPSPNTVVINTRYPRSWQKKAHADKDNATFTLRFDTNFEAWLSVLESVTNIASSPSALAGFRAEHRAGTGMESTW